MLWPAVQLQPLSLLGAGAWTVAQGASGTRAVNGVLSIPPKAMLSRAQPNSPAASSVPMRKRMRRVCPASAFWRLRVT